MGKFIPFSGRPGPSLGRKVSSASPPTFAGSLRQLWSRPAAMLAMVWMCFSLGEWGTCRKYMYTHTHIYRNIWKYMEIYGNILKYGNTGWISNVTMVMIYWKNLWLNSDWTTSRISTCTFWLNFFHGCICLYVFIYMLRSTKDRIVWLWCCAMGSLHMLLLP